MADPQDQQPSPQQSSVPNHLSDLRIRPASAAPTSSESPDELTAQTLQQARTQLPQPTITPPWQDEPTLPSQPTSKLGKAYQQFTSFLGEHERHFSEAVLAPFRQGLDNMAEDLQHAGETGHTKTGGVLSGPARALAASTGEALRMVPIGKDVKETVQMSVLPPELSPEARALATEIKVGKKVERTAERVAPDLTGIRTRPITPNASGESAASQEAINRVASEKAQQKTRHSIDTRSGKETPLVGTDAVDVQPATPYHRIVERSPKGEVVLAEGSKARPMPQGAKPKTPASTPEPKEKVGEYDLGEVNTPPPKEPPTGKPSLPEDEEPKHEPVGLHVDDLPRRARYQDVDFSAQDLQDSGKKVTAETIRKDYAGGDKNASIYQAHIPMEDLPSPQFVKDDEFDESNFDREDYRQAPRSGGVPIKVEVDKDGKMTIMDGNHRAKVWEEQDHEYAPAWVVDRRGPNIEQLSQDEIAERAEMAEEEAAAKNKPEQESDPNIVVRRGEIKEGGAYFSSKGESTYYDPDAEGVDKYHLGDSRVADTDDETTRQNILREALRDKSLTPEDRTRIQNMHDTKDIISFMDNDELPLPAAAKRLGYDGIKVWENDDISHPSSIFMWNTNKAKKLGGEAAKQDKWSIRRHPELEENEGDPERGQFQYNIHDDKGEDTGAILTGYKAKDRAFIAYIGHELDPEFSPGPKALRDVFDQLKKEHPEVKKIEWTRSSGARQDNAAQITTPLKERGKPKVGEPKEEPQLSVDEVLKRQRETSERLKNVKYETGKPTTIDAYHSTDTGELKTGTGGTFFHPENYPTEYGSKLLKKKLTFQNPFVVNDNIEAAHKLLSPEDAQALEDEMTSGAGTPDQHKLDKMIADGAKARGHDGIIYDDPMSLTQQEYVALDEKAIAEHWEPHDLNKKNDIKSEPGYVYHATNAERAQDIANEGLKVHTPSHGTDQQAWPDGATEKRSYFTDKAHQAWHFAPEDGKPALLRMKQDPNVHQRESTGDFYSKKKIGADKLEVLGNDQQWHSMAELKGEPAPPKPVTMNYVRNPEKAPNMGGRFGQDIEPHGKYINELGEGITPPKGWESGSVTFKKPLTLDFGGGYQEESNWKQVLSKKYGGKTGAKLSDAIRKDGYDGIITKRDGETSEIVDLSKPATPKSKLTPEEEGPKTIPYAESEGARAYHGTSVDAIPSIRKSGIATHPKYGTVWAADSVPEAQRYGLIGIQDYKWDVDTQSKKYNPNAEYAVAVVKTKGSKLQEADGVWKGAENVPPENIERFDIYNSQGKLVRTEPGSTTNLPPQPKLPDKGTYAAIQTDDGSIYHDRSKEGGRTHIQLAQELGIPPHRVVSGGWLKDGDYEGSERSDAGRWGEQARAQKSVEAKRDKTAGAKLGKSTDPNNPEFKKWFEGSKVVDKKGEPLTVYHGTDKPFSKVSMKKGAQGIFWVSSDKDAIARGEAGASSRSTILPMHVNLKNPAGWEEYDKLSLGELKARGYDGAILPDKDTGHFNAFVFNPDQVRINKDAAKKLGKK